MVTAAVPSVGEEQEFVVVRQVEADEQQAHGIGDGNTPGGVLDRAGHRLTAGWGSQRRQDRRAQCQQRRRRR
jgi:hypothetical protein